MTAKTLFDRTFLTDDLELRHLLTAPGARDFLDRLWNTYSPFVMQKKLFIDAMSVQPFPRIWEMYLGCALSECGLSLKAKGEEGPDIKLINPSVWVEAVASTDGGKANQTTQPTTRVPEVLLSESMLGGPPEDDIIWRLATSINKKIGKFDDYLKKGTVDPSDPCVVGLNVHKTSFSQLDHQHTPNHIPQIVKALFGYGGCVLLQFFARDGLSPPISSNHFDYEYRPHLKTLVRTDIFLRDEATTVSAVILSREGFWSWQNRIPFSLIDNFILVHNPLARNKLPKAWLKSGHEIWIEDGHLHKVIWKNKLEHSLEKFPLPHNLPAEIRTRL
jgi:hypothetical protein